MTRNLRVLMQGVHSVSEGKLDTRVPVRSKDEFGKLASAFNEMAADLAEHEKLVVHQERMRDGSRKVVNITEVSGMEGEVITMTDLFLFEQTGIENGKIVGRLRPTGLRPKFMDRFEGVGIHLPPSIFGVGSGRRY